MHFTQFFITKYMFISSFSFCCFLFVQNLRESIVCEREEGVFCLFLVEWQHWPGIDARESLNLLHIWQPNARGRFERKGWGAENQTNHNGVIV
jgi:hypothetical protein